MQLLNLNEYELTYRDIYSKFAECVKKTLACKIACGPMKARLQSSHSRPKAPDSLKRKLIERNLINSRQIEEEIKDLAGVRLIFYTQNDVNQFHQTGLIGDLFELVDSRVHHPIPENDYERYQGDHYVVRLKEEQMLSAELLQFRGLRCEVQVQTILNHAWSEMNHDMVYHMNENPDFGVGARKAIAAQLKAIMDKYIRPAGYEFQIVQQNYEMLMAGKKLFEDGAWELLNTCKHNRERFALLSDLSEGVFPFYDELVSEYPSIAKTLKECAYAAQDSAADPDFLPGEMLFITPQDVILKIVEIFQRLRYYGPEITVEELSAIYLAVEDETVRASVIRAITALANYNIDVWAHAGIHVQLVLARFIETYNKAELPTEILRAIWLAFLQSEVRGSSVNGITVTIKSYPVEVSDDLQAIRQGALVGLLRQVDNLGSSREKIHLVSQIHAALKPPRQPDYPLDLLNVLLEEKRMFWEWIGDRAKSQGYQFWAAVEWKALLNYDEAVRLTTDEYVNWNCGTAALQLKATIDGFRAIIDHDERYLQYKTLVGVSPVFSHNWAEGPRTYSSREVDDLRTARALGYIDEVSTANADYWYSLIECCCATDYGDAATFVIFSQFLRQLSSVKHDFICDIVRSDIAQVGRFLPDILFGLWQGGHFEQYYKMLDDLVSGDRFLFSIAFHCREIGAAAVPTVIKVLDLAIKSGDLAATYQCLAFAIMHHEPQKLPLVESLFLPAITYLTGRQETGWVDHVYYLREVDKFLSELSAEQIELVLLNLLACPEISDKVCKVIAAFAWEQPAAVWAFFEKRLINEAATVQRYVARPVELFELQEPLAKDAALVLRMLRGWFHLGAQSKDFGADAGWMLLAIYPTCTNELLNALFEMVSASQDEDFTFVIGLVCHYHSFNYEKTVTNLEKMDEVLRAIVGRLREKDVRLDKLARLFYHTGIVDGEYGIAEAHRATRVQLTNWLQDVRPNVRAFADYTLTRLNEQIVVDHRGADARTELGRRAAHDEEA